MNLVLRVPHMPGFLILLIGGSSNCVRDLVTPTFTFTDDAAYYFDSLIRIKWTKRGAP